MLNFNESRRSNLRRGTGGRGRPRRRICARLRRNHVVWNQRTSYISRAEGAKISAPVSARSRRDGNGREPIIKK
jgi:hypothetical protein